MSATERFVRHLRLRVEDDAGGGHAVKNAVKNSVRRVVPRLEDALRCASLPDDGARLYVVRKLALGSISPNASSQTLSRLIEQRVASLAVHWVAGGTAAADEAAFVAFPSALDARMQLALRLVRGEPCSAWYWPLAVPEFRAVWGVAANLQAIAQAIVALPEARVALPAWCVKLVDAGAASHLAASISPMLGESLLQAAGIALQSVQVRAVRADAAIAQRQVSANSAQHETTLRDLPLWLRSVLHASAEPRYQMRAVAMSQSPVSRNQAMAASDLAQSPENASLPELKTVTHTGLGADLASEPLLTPFAKPSSALTAKPVSNARSEKSPAALSALTQSSIPLADANINDTSLLPVPKTAPKIEQASSDAVPYLHLSDSACAGILFLLPVLVRLGLVQWLEQDDTQDSAASFVRRILHAALKCLRAPQSDAAWALAANDAVLEQAFTMPAPLSWADDLLRSPASNAASLAQRLAAANSTDEQAQIWLVAARRWLRRAGGIGLASLVLRPGRISRTPTHVDVYFGLNEVDMRVRRLGLDIDPGWLVWFGCVVSYHYVRHPV